MSTTDQSPEKQTYPIGIVGMRGAGKTVYLAAMSHQLAIHRSDVGFFVQTPQEGALIDMFATLSIKHKWLEANEVDKIREWDFSVNVMTPQRTLYEACRYRYYDYAGELLEHGARRDGQEIGTQLDEKLANCTALIGMLDGEKICHALKNTDVNKTIELFSVDIPYVIGQLKKPKGGKIRAVQIIISKWDELQKNNITLKDIKNLLMRDANFSGYISSITPKAPTAPDQSLITVRLIPVSSVGFNFVERYDPELGMIIKDDARVEPWNVAVPFNCLLPDIIGNEIKLQKAMKEATLSKEFDPKRGVFYHVVRGVRFFLLGAAGALDDIIPDFVQEAIFGFGAEYERRKDMEVSERYEQFEKDKADAIQKVHDSLSAFQYVLMIFGRLQEEFDRWFPDNKLA